MNKKMCSVGDLLGVGYTSSEVSDNSYCPPVGVFLGKFVKTGYTSTVSGRSNEQLFPLSDISESQIVLEPTLVFDHPSLEMASTESSKNNGFTYSNLEGPWTVTISDQSTEGHFSASVDSANNRVLVTSLFSGSSVVDETCTVTLTGTRVDGQGTYSASFKVLQYAKVTTYYLKFYNNVSDRDGGVVFNISNGTVGDNAQVIFGDNSLIPLYYGSTITVTNRDYESYDVKFIMRSSDNILLSGNGYCINACSIGYDTILQHYPGKEGTTITVFIEEHIEYA